ncbi:MFS transporter [Nonomuraea sp. NPDC001831]|uniref:MFS transporter n=1 Tax=Nonomuraea sp. NPDC001831 TaxID=3364340 RepID=UPI003682D52E
MAAPAGATTVVVLLMAAVFLSLLDSQIVATALPRIVADLGGLDRFAWVTTGYLIAGSVAVPVHGKLGDLYGRKRVFLVSVLVFLAGSVACGLAQTMTQLIGFRVVQGVGSGGLFISVLSVLGEMFTPQQGARYYGWFYPVIPLRLFRDRTFSVVVAVGFLAGFLGLGIVNYLVLWLQAVLCLGVRTSGYLLTAMMLGVALTSYASTRLIARTGSYRRHPAASMILFALAGLLCAVVDAGPVLAAVLLLLYGVAGGLNSQALSLAARNVARRDDLGAVQGTAAMARQTGTALGTSFFAALVTGRLPAHPGPAAYADALHLVFIAVIPIALIGLALSLLLPDVKLARS